MINLFWFSKEIAMKKYKEFANKKTFMILLRDEKTVLISILRFKATRKKLE